jgi:hypothetical protein
MAVRLLILLVTAFGASFLTFFSGFGLGTLLVPVMAMFFPVEVAIAMTAIIHLFHYTLKSIALWRYIDWKIAIPFGGVAILAAVPGAWLLGALSHLPSLREYVLLGMQFKVSFLGIVIGSIFFLIATNEVTSRKFFAIKNLYISGAISGFLGGLSGNQGAFRSTFLLQRQNEAKEFIATSAVISVAVDIIRIVIYGVSFFSIIADEQFSFLMAAGIGAAAAIALGIFTLEKITIGFIRSLVIILLYLFSVLLIFGFF